MKIENLKIINLKAFKKVIALAVLVGALPFVFCTHAYAEEAANSQEPKAKSQLLDDYTKPVGFTYSAKATLQTAYLWRGLYSGAMNVQADASVGYGGLYLTMWWNIGVTNWKFDTFQPEVDFSLGFNRWGLNVYMLYIHNFNCGFFDFANYADKGNRLEINARYTISSKIPLAIHWGTRVSAADGYLDDNGELHRAWSSYFQLSYTQALPYGLSLYGAVGMSPWKSVYSRFKGDFVVNNVELSLTKDWSVSTHCGMALFGKVVVNPSAIARDKSSVQWHPDSPGNQSVNANIGFQVYLK